MWPCPAVGNREVSCVIGVSSCVECFASWELSGYFVNARVTMVTSLAKVSLRATLPWIPPIMTAFTTRSSRPPQLSPDVVRVLLDDGGLDEQHDPRLSPEDQVAVYRHMLQTRLLEERFIGLQRQGRIAFHVGSLGEEATIIGTAFALRQNDWIFSCYREYGAALMRGLPLQKLLDNLVGNQNDTVKGRQMPHHYTSRAIGWASISSPVGTQITHAVGFAWAAKLDRVDRVSLTYFGDGATSSVDFHSAMNMAGVFRIPCVFLCRNNGWAISTPSDR